MPRYRVEVSARALGWVEGIEAESPEAACDLARADWHGADFDAFEDVEIEGWEEEGEDD